MGRIPLRAGSTGGRAATRTARCRSSCSSPSSRPPCGSPCSCYPTRGGSLMSAVAPDNSCAGHDPATRTPNWPASTWPGRWWQPPRRSPPPSWPSATSTAAPSACRSPTRCSTLSSPPCRCGTGRTCRPGSPRSAAYSPRVGCWSSPTSFPAAAAGVRPLPCCAAVTPRCRLSSAPCWPPTAWPSSAATIPTGSACPTSRSSQRNSHISRAANPPTQQQPAPLRYVGVPLTARLGRALEQLGDGEWVLAVRHRPTNEAAVVGRTGQGGCTLGQGSRRPMVAEGYRFRVTSMKA